MKGFAGIFITVVLAVIVAHWVERSFISKGR